MASPFDPRRVSPSAARNREPILAVLREKLPPAARVLELASGSGAHAVHFVTAMPLVHWVPSDPDPDARASIEAWAAEAGDGRISAPRAIDARSDDWGVEGEFPFDAVACINMIHISPWAATEGLMRGAARVLRPAGRLIVYGPFARDGRHTAPSNAAFDADLKARCADWGVRDLADVEAAANAAGLALLDVIDMPANNLTLVFTKPGRARAG